MSTETGAITPARAGWKLWLVGIVALLWNAIGALDYVMTQTRNAAYMEQFTPEQLEYFYSFPAWVTAGWAIAVWGGVLGSVLLLLRKRLAEPVYLVSFVAMVITTIHNFVLTDGHGEDGRRRGRVLGRHLRRGARALPVRTPARAPRRTDLIVRAACLALSHAGGRGLVGVLSDCTG